MTRSPKNAFNPRVTVFNSNVSFRDIVIGRVFWRRRTNFEFSSFSLQVFVSVSPASSPLRSVPLVRPLFHFQVSGLFFGSKSISQFVFTPSNTRSFKQFLCIQAWPILPVPITIRRSTNLCRPRISSSATGFRLHWWRPEDTMWPRFARKVERSSTRSTLRFVEHVPISIAFLCATLKLTFNEH